ncbi:hypothetical protein QYF36_014473 [Acer negundo]|nr:hypothetical protein QYF36_014473 [Acer negundo]
MGNNIDVSRELELAGLKKQSLERACEVAHSQSNSIMLLTLQWKELEEHLNKTMKSVEEKGIEVDSKLKLLEERERVVELKESELVSVQTRIEECNGELESKIKELGSVQRSIEECNGEIEGKETELGSIRRRIEECSCEFRKREGELDVLRTSVSDWTEKLSLKNEELRSIEGLIEKLECNGELESKIKKLGLVRRSIEECNGEIEGKKTELDSIRRRIKECSCEFRKREGELDVLRTSVSDWIEKLELKQNQLSETERLIEVHKEKFDLEEQSIKTLIQDFNEELEAKEHDYNEIKKSIQACNKELETKREKLKLTEKRLAELHSQVGKLESLKNNARRRIDSTEKKLSAMKGELRRYGNDIELREREFNALCKYTDECNEELTLKQQQLNLVHDSIEKCTKELKEKEELSMSIEKTLVKCSEELEQKKKQLGSVQNSLGELSDEHLSEELELDLVRSMTSQVYKELKEKEQHFNSLENSVKERVQDLEVKEAQFEERVKKRVQVKIEQPESLGASEGIENGRILQMLMNEHLKKADFFLSEISSALERAHDPAKLVLDAMQGFYPKHLLGKKTSPDLIVIRRTCMLLLQRLLIVSPLIIPQVRDAAMKLAGEWKEKMRVVADNPLEVLGFLNLVAAFGLASDFDGNELGKLLDIADPLKQEPELYHALGITDQLYVNQIVPSQIRIEQSEHITVVSKTTMPKEVSAALLVSLDPAKHVLDLIQGSYSENKKEGTNIEEGIMRNYILLLEQLQEVLPKINPQVKAQALKLAVKWKSKMRAVAENSLEIFGFLQFLATYELVVSFQREEIFELLFPVAHLKQALKICTALGFVDMVPDFVRILIDRNRLIDAIRFICSFKLMNNISPVPVIKKYMENVDISAANIYKEGNYSLDVKDKALSYRIASLRALIECTEDFKLDYLISTENIRKGIVNLEKQIAELNQFLLASNPMTPPQFIGENCNVASPSYQPASGLMFQPQHGDNNHSSGASVAGSVQKCIVKPVKENSQWTHFVRAPNVMTPQQLLQGKNCNFGASTAASQPAFGPAVQNYSSSASVPRNQLHQQNSNKRPRTDQGPGVSNVLGKPQHN